MNIQDILKQIDDMAAANDRESLDQIGMRASRIRMLIAAADGDPREPQVRLHAEIALERLRGVVRRRIHDELRAILRTEVTL